MPKPSKPAEVWIGPNSPDPEGNDLIDPAYEPATVRSPIAIANGTKINARTGKLDWNWRKL